MEGLRGIESGGPPTAASASCRLPCASRPVPCAGLVWAARPASPRTPAVNLWIAQGRSKGEGTCLNLAHTWTGVPSLFILKEAQRLKTAQGNREAYLAEAVRIARSFEEFILKRSEGRRMTRSLLHANRDPTRRTPRAIRPDAEDRDARYRRSGNIVHVCLCLRTRLCGCAGASPATSPRRGCKWLSA